MTCSSFATRCESKPGQVLAWSILGPGGQYYKAHTSEGREIIAKSVGSTLADLETAFDGVRYYPLAENKQALQGDFSAKTSPTCSRRRRRPASSPGCHRGRADRSALRRGGPVGRQRQAPASGDGSNEAGTGTKARPVPPRRRRRRSSGSAPDQPRRLHRHRRFGVPLWWRSGRPPPGQESSTLFLPSPGSVWLRMVPLAANGTLWQTRASASIASSSASRSPRSWPFPSGS